jgi:Family of unknown function (DUF6279)
MNTSFVFSASFKRLIIGALLAVLLVGCSAIRLGYNQVPSLAYWWLDGYVDLKTTQTPQLEEDLAAWLEWHRRTQLPAYASLLARAQAEVREPVTAAQMCRWSGEVVQQLETAFEHFVPALARLSVSLSPAQINHLERQYAKGNAKAADEFLQGNPADRLKASTKRLEERATMFLGKLSEAQRERIQRSVAEAPLSSAQWLEERKNRQQDIVRALRRINALATSTVVNEKARVQDEAQASMRALAVNIQRSPREAYRVLQQRALEHQCQLAADLVNLSTPAQRQVVVGKLKGWEEDARALAMP